MDVSRFEQERHSSLVQHGGVWQPNEVPAILPSEEESESINSGQGIYGVYV
jgi:hypothetical protein